VDYSSINWKKSNTQYSIRSYIPLTLTRNRWMTGIAPYITLSYNNYYLYSPETNNFQRGLWKMLYQFQAYRLLKTSLRDLYSRRGFLIQGGFQHAPWNSSLYGQIYYVYGRVYLPGIGRHHSLRISGAWQRQKIKEIPFNSLLNFPRGYFTPFTEKLTMGTIDYSLPICYPDWNLSCFVYMKRLHANLFCDIGLNQYRLQNSGTSQLLWNDDKLFSFGVDLLTDVNLLRINFPINLGIRTVYVPEFEKLQPSLLLSVVF